MRIRRLLLVLATGGLMFGCGIPVESSPVLIDVEYEPASAVATATENLVAASMYLVRDGALVPVTRDLTGPLTLTEIMESLLGGPTVPEERSQLRTAIPVGTRLLGVELVGSVAHIDLSREFTAVGGEEEIFAVAQIVLTLTESEQVEGVAFRLDGIATNVPLTDGALSNEPVSRPAYLSLLGLGNVD